MLSWRLIRQILVVTLVVSVSSLSLGRSNLEPGDQTERVRSFTRQIEFDYVAWTLGALRVKLFDSALGASNYLTESNRRQAVMEYLELIGKIQQVEGMIRSVYSDPAVTDAQTASQPLRQVLEALKRRRESAAPLAEAILQSQINYIAAELGLAPGGQAIPPILYHSTPLPLALIVSPRNVIRQDDDVSLIPDLPLDQQVLLEERVDRSLNVSSLVVNIGGVGVYPTMVQQTTNLEWLSEVVAHEWIHNYLTLRPLGLNYMTSPELRIMNETTASIAGKEIGLAVLERFYPELVPLPAPPVAPATPAEPPAFDFRKEMHLTRVEVDRLLAEGKIDEAEAYMEERRKIFWENGYRGLRKLNQAYFAFYGAYADTPQGAAGEDPVGAAVRALRAQSPSLAAFVNKIAWMDSFEQLKQAVEISH